MKRYLPFIIVGGIALVTLASGAMLYWAKRPQLLTIPADKTMSGKGDAESMHIRGNPDAPVTLEEFGDFQCPPCAGIAGFLDALEKEYHPRLRIVFRNFPLPVHKHARDAALAAEAAGLQGRYWEMHDVLYREQAVWSKADSVHELFESYAGVLGINLDRFKKDMKGDDARKQVDFEQARGNSLGVKSTPTIFVNNHQVRFPLTAESVHEAIDSALKKKS
jgi:protein-disulfide isomerase